MRAAPLILLALACGCGGSAPVRFPESTLGFSAVLVRSRLFSSSGETSDGSISLNLESAQERYACEFPPKETAMLRVEPGVYRLGPTRGLLGSPNEHLRVRIQGRNYLVAFPREILRLDAFTVKPTEVVPLGILEARLLPMEKGRSASVAIRFDSSVGARRRLVEDSIHAMQDPKMSSDVQASLLTWTKALSQALVRVQEETDRPPAFKPHP
jgi:hypothetical protein